MMTVREAAAKLSLSEIRVYQLLYEGRIVSAKVVKGHWRVPDEPRVKPLGNQPGRPVKGWKRNGLNGQS